MKKKNRNINWEYRLKLADVWCDGILGGLWFIEIFIQLCNHDYTTSTWVLACLSAILSACWFVLAYHQWEQLKTIPKTIKEDKDEG